MDPADRGTPAADQAIDSVAERVLDAAVHTADLIGIAIGDRLGYYRCLAEQGPVTADELAMATGTVPRYTREWLEQQAVSGLLVPHGDRFGLAPGVAGVLAEPDELSYLAPLARQLLAAARMVPAIAEAARTGSGVPWSDYGVDMRESQAELNRPGFLRLLPTEWLAALPDVRARLWRTGARVADVGCGAGWAAIGLARAYPRVRVDAFDLDPASVALARRNVAAHGLTDRVTVHEQDIGTVAETGYDLAMAFECLHDLPHPVPALRAMRRLSDNVLIADMKVADEFTAPGNPLERLIYGFSISICLPDSMSSPDSAATGTAIRRATVRQYAEDAGFLTVETLPIQHDFWYFYRLRG
jgi:SAM-dependent methyltransferase